MLETGRAGTRGGSVAEGGRKESTIEPGALTSFAGTPARHVVAKSKAGEEDRKKRSAVVILNL